MEMWIRLLGAFVVTYLVSRILFAALGERAKTGILPIVGVHLVSFVALAILVGLIRAYFVKFEWDAVTPYLPTQLLWLILDTIRFGRKR